jgi:hypothetical protein
VAVSLSLTAELVSDSFIMGGMLYYLYNGRSSFAKSVIGLVCVAGNLADTCGAARTEHSTKSLLTRSTVEL